MGQWYFGVPGGTSRIKVVAALTAASLVAWVLVVARMEGMDDGPGTDLGSAEWYVGIWVTMMAAMMLPSAAPMVLLHSRLARGVVAAPGTRDGALRDRLPRSRGRPSASSRTERSSSCAASTSASSTGTAAGPSSRARRSRSRASTS